MRCGKIFRSACVFMCEGPIMAVVGLERLRISAE